MTSASSTPTGNAHMAFAHRRPKRKWKVKLLLATCLSLPVLMISTQPWAPEAPSPTAAEVNAAKALFERVSKAGDLPGDQPVQASWAELRSVAIMGGRAGGIRRVELDRAGSRGLVTASIALPLGLWSNVQLNAEADENKALRVSGRIGRVPVPAFLTRAAFGAARMILGWRGATVPPLEKIIHSVYLNDQGILAVVDLPKESKLFSALSGLRPSGVDAARVADHYCKLVSLQNANPSFDLAQQIRRAFTAGDGTVVDNRSAFVALAMLTASTKVGQLAGGAEAIVAKCDTAVGEITLLGRADLAKHWTISAALTSAFGPDASIAMGTWKEISDSGQGGSGFSLVDLSADRSGTFMAQRASDGSTALALQRKLAHAEEATLLPVSALAFAEGMSEAEFQKRFASTDSAAYAATVARIDETLSSVMQP